jgi:hypothetical protein
VVEADACPYVAAVVEAATAAATIIPQSSPWSRGAIIAAGATTIAPLGAVAVAAAVATATAVDAAAITTTMLLRVSS